MYEDGITTQRTYSDLSEREERQRERMRRNSTTGGAARRTREKKISMSRKAYVSRLKTMIATGAVAGVIAASLVITGGSSAITSYKNGMVLSENSQTFHQEVIAPETHRTNDLQHYFYDYADIEQKMSDYYENYDEALYYCLNNIGEYQTNKVLRYSDKYSSVEDMLQQKNYEELDDFVDDIKEQILLESDMEKKAQELKSMQDEHATLQDEAQVIELGNTSIGGK